MLRPLKLMFADTACDAEKGTEAVRQLIQAGVVALFFYSGAGGVHDLKQLLAESGVRRVLGTDGLMSGELTSSLGPEQLAKLTFVLAAAEPEREGYKRWLAMALEAAGTADRRRVSAGLRAIMQSLLLMPGVVRVTSLELAQGQVVKGSPFQFDYRDEALAKAAAFGQSQLEFPVLVKRPAAAPETVGTLTITYSDAELIEQNNRVMFSTMATAGRLASLVIAALTSALNRSVLRPIGKVSASAGQPDDPFVPIELNTGDQLGQLVTAFNDLRARHIESTRLLKTARDEAIAANAAKSAFLAMMSHELRTPLNAVIGYSEMLKDELAEEGVTATTMGDLDKIKSAGKHLLELIYSVLDLSKIEAGKIELESARSAFANGWTTQPPPCTR